MDKERSQLQTELALHRGYSMLLAEDLPAVHLPILAAIKILGRGPIIPPFE